MASSAELVPGTRVRIKKAGKPDIQGLTGIVDRLIEWSPTPQSERHPSNRLATRDGEVVEPRLMVVVRLDVPPGHYNGYPDDPTWLVNPGKQVVNRDGQYGCPFWTTFPEHLEALP